ncbi:MAG: rRNA maturation RNase YbeY [Candidatus Pacebacteria bacterium]|nr:rRNA maturation RNase YbeY [Candidatus Paceibacterota bacterium]
MLEINNLTERKINEELLREVAKKVLEGEKRKGVISLVFIGPNRMRKLNYKYKKKNRVTDVLSFSQISEKGKFIFPPGTRSELGEIFICPREVKKRAKRQNLDFEKELVRTFIHGLLHLLGYDHQKEKDAQIMFEKEEKYLKTFFN